MHRRRLAGLALAFTLHVFCLLAVIPSRPATTADRQEHAAAPAVTPVESPKPEPSSRYLPRPALLRVRGFDFDVRKIRARWNALFPFITAPPALDADALSHASSRRLVFADPLVTAPPLPPAKPRLALVMIGGLVTSTLFTLLVLPAFYLQVHGWLERRANRADAAPV